MPHIPDIHAHADHDLELIAAYASGDATGADLDIAIALVAGCTECAALHHDLRAIAAALPALPAPVRRRDFRLTPEQAARLRPAGWRRLAGWLAGPRFAFAGPLGASLATLGLAVLLLTGPGLSLGLGGAASADRTSTDQFAGAAASPAATAAAPNVAPEPAATTRPVDAGAVVSSPGAGTDITGGGDSGGEVAPATPGSKSSGPVPDTLAPGGPSPLPLAAVAVAIVGIGLLVLRLAARRAV